MKTPEDLLKDVKTLAVVCTQWGDTGKGKFVDYFAEWADIVARGTGGANAGHTIILEEEEHIFHLIPSGILRDKDGTVNVIGSGVAFDLRVIVEEMDVLNKSGYSHDNLFFSHDAHLVLPQHLVLDRIKESDSGKAKIGTTGRGIGPVYTDHYARIGLRLNDILNPEIFRQKLEKNLKDKIRYLKDFTENNNHNNNKNKEILKHIMNHEHLENGIFYDEENIFNIEAILDKYLEYGELIKNKIKDTDQYVRDNLGKKKILLEGAQGNMLGIDIGTYPYVTSSDPSIRGLAKGVGIRQEDVDLTLGIAKAFFMTRVGEGPFPTEIGGKWSEEWCGSGENTKASEKEKFKDATINDKDEKSQGVAIRIAGGEYGATTGRPRRVGWLDLPLLRYSMKFTGKDIILTKVDVLDNANEIKLCVKYKYIGPDYNLGNKELKTGDILDEAISHSEVMKYCEPIYETFSGWNSDTTKSKNWDDLPNNLQKIVKYIEKECNVNVRIVSVGPDRKETVIV